jgi:ribosomal protein S9
MKLIIWKNVDTSRFFNQGQSMLMKERKKPGLKGARRAPQFSKR